MSNRLLPLRLARQIRFQHHPTMTACWIWTGYSHPKMGPRCSLDGTTVQARRAVYSLLVGTPPPKLRDECCEKLCVNPHHMKKD
jgi:hypothetical protein